MLHVRPFRSVLGGTETEGIDGRVDRSNPSNLSNLSNLEWGNMSYQATYTRHRTYLVLWSNGGGSSESKPVMLDAEATFKRLPAGVPDDRVPGVT